MADWYDSVVVADSESLTAGAAVSEDINRLRSPVVCVSLEDLEGAADDTATIEIVGDAGAYEVDSRALSATGTYTVEAPQAGGIRFTSSNGVTYSVEVRANP